MNRAEKVFWEVAIAGGVGAFLGYLFFQPKVAVASPPVNSPFAMPTTKPATPAITTLPAAQTSSSSPPFGPSVILSPGALTGMSTSPSTGPINIAAPTGGTITSLATSDAKLLGTSATAPSVTVNTSSVGLYYDSTSAGKSGTITANWTDSTGAAQQSTIPVSITN
jgi:hypothetical protein